MDHIVPAPATGYGARAAVTQRINRGGARDGAPGGSSPQAAVSLAGGDWQVGTPSRRQRAQPHPRSGGVSTDSGSMGRAPSGKSPALVSGEWPSHRLRMGAATVRTIACAQFVASLSWTALALLLWYALLPATARLPLLALCGALIAAGSALSMELARGARGASARLLVARLLLPAVSLLAAAGAFWLLAGDTLALALFLPSALLATLLLGWRAGVIAAAGGIVAAVAMELALGVGGGLAWMTGLLVLGLGQALLVAGLATYARRVGGAQTQLLARAHRAEQRRDEVAAERTQLLDGVRLLEQTHLRLERERAALDRQTGEMAHIVRRLADGDPQGAREQLARLMSASGPIGQALAQLATGIGRLAQLDVAAPALDPRHQGQALARLLGEQTNLLDATDLALRDQAAVANQLVAAIQLLAHGASGPSGQAGADRRLASSTMRDIEQLALGHASSTAMLGARMAQMRKRQGELDTHLRELTAAVRPATATDKLARESGAVRPANAGAPPAADGAGAPMHWLF